MVLVNEIAGMPRGCKSGFFYNLNWLQARAKRFIQF